MTADHLVVLITASSQGEARKIARALVEERLAACVNVIPGVESFYRWKGEICQEPEVLLVVKTLPQRFEALERRVRELHSYEVPEIVALPIQRGSKPYLDWLAESSCPVHRPPVHRPPVHRTEEGEGGRSGGEGG